MGRLSRLAWRRPIAVLCAALLAVQMGCYSFLPIQETAPQSGEVVGVTLNDRGRQLLGERLGELVDRVDGTIITATESSVTLSVTRVRSLRGTNSIWSGEQVEIPREGIRGFQARQFSRGRSVMLAVGLIAGVVAVAGLISLAVGGLGKPNGGGTCPPDCNQQ